MTHYCLKIQHRDGRGELLPLPPSRVTIIPTGYSIRRNNGYFAVRREDIFRFSSN